MSMPSIKMLNPGPVEVPESILKAICKPVVHQRTALFDDFFSELQGNLKYVFQTSFPVVAMPGTGTFGVESAMYSLFQPGDQVAIPALGKFSERWVAFGMALGLEVVPIGVAWGHAFTLDHVRAVLEEYPDLKGWVLTHVETSTGVAIDLEEMAGLIKSHNADQLILVDGICSVGIQPLYMDAWQLDAVVAASQKGFLSPAGTVYVALGQLALSRIIYPEAADYRHLGHYLRYLQQGSYPFTPPIQLFYGVNEACKQMKAVGLPAWWNRTHQLSRFFKEEVQALGGTLFGQGNADALTVFSFGRMSHGAIREQLVLHHGIETAGGQDHIEDLVIRVGHFGPHGMEALQACIEGLKQIVPAKKA
jgi:aspartate aminotransferase-like enzyme